MLKFTLIVSFLLFSVAVIAQKQNVYFLKNNGKYVDVRDSADFIRVVREPDSASTLYNVFEFYKTGEKKLIGKSSKIDPPVFEGSCITYYKNGRKQRLVTYYHGEPTGLEYDFHTNGRLFMLKQFADTSEKEKYKKLTYNYLIMEVQDTSGNVLVTKGNGFYKGYYTNFGDDEEQGLVKDGEMEGEWRGTEKKTKMKYVENYENGILAKGIATDSAGVTQTYSIRQKNPEFAGGLAEFYKYLGKTIVYPDDAREHNIQGIVMVGFVVEKDGAVSDVKINKSLSRTIDREAIRVIAKSPHWIPGTVFGRNVRCAYTIPLSFTLSN